MLSSSSFKARLLKKRKTNHRTNERGFTKQTLTAGHRRKLRGESRRRGGLLECGRIRTQHLWPLGPCDAQLTLLTGRWLFLGSVQVSQRFSRLDFKSLCQTFQRWRSDHLPPRHLNFYFVAIISHDRPLTDDVITSALDTRVVWMKLLLNAWGLLFVIILYIKRNWFRWVTPGLEVRFGVPSCFGLFGF